MTIYYTPPTQKKKTPGYTYIVCIVIVLFLSWLIFKPTNEILDEVSNQKIELPKEINIGRDKDMPTQAIIKNKTITLETKSGDNLSSLFNKASLSNLTLLTILKQIPHKKILHNIKPNQVVRFTLTPKQKLIKLVYEISNKQHLIININDSDHYSSKLIKIKTIHETHYITGTIKGSLYTTGIKQHIPHKLLVQLTRIFARKINFSKDLRDNDKFTLIYQTNIYKNKNATIDKIIAASFTNKKTTKFAIESLRFDKEHDYFTPNGQSLKLGFDRYPIKFTHISSHFDPYRMHPILNKARPHRGVDLAAKQGTPIHAVADGKIIQIGKNSGYGNMIKIKHSKKYETVYAHMVRFKTGLSRGAKIKRGDIIGYVGQTGLATGPHCHFEFRIFHKAVDPTTIALPSAPSINKKQLLAFKEKSRHLLEKLKLYQTSNNIKSHS